MKLRGSRTGQSIFNLCGRIDLEAIPLHSMIEQFLEYFNTTLKHNRKWWITFKSDLTGRRIRL